MKETLNGRPTGLMPLDFSYQKLNEQVSEQVNAGTQEKKHITKKDENDMPLSIKAY